MGTPITQQNCKIAVHSLDDNSHILCLSTNINIHPERKVCLSVKLTFMQTRTYKQVCS